MIPPLRGTKVQGANPSGGAEKWSTEGALPLDPSFMRLNIFIKSSFNTMMIFIQKLKEGSKGDSTFGATLLDAT